MLIRLLTFFLLILCTGELLHATPTPSKYRGWDYLAGKLIAEGIPEKTVRSIYGSRLMPLFSEVPFSLNPKEPADIYRRFSSPEYLALAVKNLKLYKTAFTNAEKEFQVDRYTIAAILLVETQFGKYTGHLVVVERLSRLANIADPENVKKNTARLKKEDPEVTLAPVAARARYLEDTFYPEIPALITVAERNNISVFDIKGSYAGAFGLPQFLPSAYVRFGVDADKDGRISLYSPADAISSAANFLHSYGWLPTLSTAEKKKVLWNYNRSDPYIEAILHISGLLRARMKASSTGRTK